MVLAVKIVMYMSLVFFVHQISCGNIQPLNLCALLKVCLPLVVHSSCGLVVVCSMCLLHSGFQTPRGTCYVTSRTVHHWKQQWFSKLLLASSTPLPLTFLWPMQVIWQSLIWMGWKSTRKGPEEQTEQKTAHTMNKLYSLSWYASWSQIFAFLPFTWKIYSTPQGKISPEGLSNNGFRPKIQDNFWEVSAFGIYVASLNMET